MNTLSNFSIITWFMQAHMIGKIIMITLIFMSILSWALIIFKFSEFQRLKKMNKIILLQLKSNEWDVNTLYQSTKHLPEHLGHGLMVKHAFEVVRHPNLDNQNIDEAFKLMLDNAIDQTEYKCEKNLSLLSSIAAIAPYIGLLGTVFGIMTTFLELGGQANIEKIMPSIAESLIVTGLGLFVAIPAAWMYNQFQNQIDELLAQLNIFKQNIMYQTLQKK
jgi:biopolymer transport protein TolQ